MTAKNKNADDLTTYYFSFSSYHPIDSTRKTIEDALDQGN